MAHGSKSNEKIVYVGDSRVIKRTNKPVAYDYAAYPGKSEVFIPNFLLKEWMVAVVALVGVLVLVMSEPAPLGYPADPTNTSFIPMPDWYFLFMYQLLKYPYASDQFVVIGTLIFPGLLFGGLLLAPFLDTGKERRFYRRPIASSLMFVSLIAVIYLTVFSWHHYQQELEASGTIPEHIKAEKEREEARHSGQPAPSASKPTAAVAIVDETDPAAQLYQKSTCISCHGADLKGMAAAKIPALRGVGDKHDKAGLIAIMKNGVGAMPAGQYDASKQKGLSDADMDKLAEWLAKQKKAQ